MANTLLATGLCIAIALPVGAWLAVLLTRSNVWGRRWAGLAVASQLAIPLYVFAGGWSAGLGLQGWLRLADWLGPSGVGWMQGWWGSLLAVGLIHALASLPWVCLILSLGLLRSDRNEEETALLEGGWPLVWRHVWWPRLRPWLWAACWWCAMGLLTEMVVSNLYMFSTVAELVYLDVSRDTVSPLTYWAATGACMLPLLLVGLAAYLRLPELRQVLARQQHFSAGHIDLGRWRTPLSLILWGLVIALVATPIGNLLIKAGWTPVVVGQQVVGYGWSLGRFLKTAQESLTLFHAEFYWSLLLALCSATTAMLLGITLYALTSVDRLAPRWPSRRGWVHAAMLLLIATPGPLAGSMVTWLLNRPSPAWLGDLYYTTLTAPVLAQQFRLLPMSWLLICATLAGISQRSWDLTVTDGLNRGGVFRYVLWPPSRRSGPMIFVMLWLLSIGELSCSIGVLPRGHHHLDAAVRDSALWHATSGLGTVRLLIVLGWVAAWLLFRWSSEHPPARSH